MDTRVASICDQALRAAQEGDREAAHALLAGVDNAIGEALLVKGYLLLPVRPDAARDLLAQAKRSLAGNRAQLAAVYEARAYEYLGQVAEGRILINAVLKDALDQETLAQALLVKAVLDAGYPMRALSSLNKIPMGGLRPGLKGRIHNQRARMFSELRELDKALIEYAGAASFFQEAGNASGVAHALNNQAGVERKLRQFEQAHCSVDNALSVISLSDPFRADFMDRKAQILIDEGRYIEAERWAREAVGLVVNTDRVSCYIECVCTLAQSVAGQGLNDEAAALLREVTTIATRLDSNELLFTIQHTRKVIAERFVQEAEVRLVELALKTCNGCVRAAAKKLDMTHGGITKLMKRNNRCWTPKKPARLNLTPVTKSRK